VNVVLSGASGLIGSALARRLIGDGHRATPLVRREARADEIRWDPNAGTLDPKALEGVDAVVHLAGENVGARWTAARKHRIRSSRVQGTRVLSEALARAPTRATALVSASAIGIYGDRGDEVLNESSSLGDPDQDFLVSVGQEWEAAAEPARA
jgi:uncharacterized protein